MEPIKIKFIFVPKKNHLVSKQNKNKNKIHLGLVC